MKTYYIEVEGYADTTLNVIKVKANSEEEACKIAKEHITANLYFSAISKKEAEEKSQEIGQDIEEAD